MTGLLIYLVGGMFALSTASTMSDLEGVKLKFGEGFLIFILFPIYLGYLFGNMAQQVWEIKDSEEDTEEMEKENTND